MTRTDKYGLQTSQSMMLQPQGYSQYNGSPQPVARARPTTSVNDPYVPHNMYSVGPTRAMNPSSTQYSQPGGYQPPPTNLQSYNASENHASVYGTSSTLQQWPSQAALTSQNSVPRQPGFQPGGEMHPAQSGATDQQLMNAHQSPHSMQGHPMQNAQPRAPERPTFGGGDSVYWCDWQSFEIRDFSNCWSTASDTQAWKPMKRIYQYHHASTHRCVNWIINSSQFPYRLPFWQNPSVSRSLSLFLSWYAFCPHVRKRGWVIDYKTAREETMIELWASIEPYSISFSFLE